ncbi:Hypothetical protein of unknown function [Listeria monocytogenes serotype 4b str. CLIP 80459]|nr:Hypothetical protein of unknown function [Listeria monocytogenes serotype 4b str. CLIP 80459]
MKILYYGSPIGEGDCYIVSKNLIGLLVILMMAIMLLA